MWLRCSTKFRADGQAQRFFPASRPWRRLPSSSRYGPTGSCGFPAAASCGADVRPLARKRVLCEKPMPSPRRGRANARGCQGSGSIWRWDLRRFFRRRKPSPICGPDVWRSESFRWRRLDIFLAGESASFFNEKRRRRVLLDLGVHSLDLLLHWFGEAREIQYRDDAMRSRGQLPIKAGLESAAGEVRFSRDWRSPTGVIEWNGPRWNGRWSGE